MAVGGSCFLIVYPSLGPNPNDFHLSLSVWTICLPCFMTPPTLTALGFFPTAVCRCTFIHIYNISQIMSTYKQDVTKFPTMLSLYWFRNESPCSVTDMLQDYFVRQEFEMQHNTSCCTSFSITHPECSVTTTLGSSFNVLASTIYGIIACLFVNFDKSFLSYFVRSIFPHCSSPQTEGKRHGSDGTVNKRESYKPQTSMHFPLLILTAGNHKFKNDLSLC